MSAKKQLAAAVEALPDSLTLEEAVARLYRAFKRKRAALGEPRSERVFGAHRGAAQVTEAFFEPLPEAELEAWES